MMTKQTLNKSCLTGILILVFSLCLSLQVFGQDIQIKNLTFANESAIPDFPVKPNLIYMMSYNDLKFYIGIENPVSIDLNDSTLDESDLVAVLENPKLTILLSREGEKIPVDNPQLKETLFGYLKP